MARTIEQRIAQAERMLAKLGLDKRALPIRLPVDLMGTFIPEVVWADVQTPEASPDEGQGSEQRRQP